jgi:hypothetical protein
MIDIFSLACYAPLPLYSTKLKKKKTLHGVAKQNDLYTAGLWIGGDG